MPQFTPHQHPLVAPMELWSPLDAYEASHYEISNRGEIRHAQRRSYPKPSINQHGVRFMTVRKFGRYQGGVSIPIARAVAHEFLPEPEDPTWNTVIHKDGDKGNCRVENLAYRTRSYANRYKRECDSDEERAPERSVAAVNGFGEVICYFGTVLEFARAYGILELDALASIQRGSEIPFNPGVFGRYS